MDRKPRIMELARTEGRVLVDSLAEQLGVSAHTIRRDINALCEAGRLRRVHGGAALIEGTANMPYAARAVLNFQAKQAIARATARLIADGATVFISIGTTPALVATALAEKAALTVITNNLNAAMALSENTANRLILPGGELRLPDRDFLSESAIKLFASYRADYGIYGVGGIDRDGSLLDFHEPEVRARQQIRQSCNTAILVADRSKFGRRAAAVGGTLDEADWVVLDRQPDPDYAPLLGPLGARLVLASDDEAAP